jgi:CRP-like cAMP-binding protein
MPVDADHLKQVPLFSGLSDEELGTIAGWLMEQSASEGQRLTPEGASGYTLFLIEQGTAQVSKDGEQIAELSAGNYFGEMAILGTGRRAADVVAATPMKLLVLFGTEFRQLQAAFPQIADRLVATMRERLRRARLSHTP